MIASITAKQERPDKVPLLLSGKKKAKVLPFHQVDAITHEVPLLLPKEEHCCNTATD